MTRAVSLAAYVLVAAGGFALGGLTLPPSGLRGHYYDNLTRTGAPVATAIDESISTDTLDNGTAGVWESFSVEWTGAIVIARSGRYRFATISDDGSELEIDGQTIVHNGGQHGPQQANGTIALAAGVHAIRVRYEQDGGGFALTILSAREQAPLQPISSSVLLPDPLTTTQYLWRVAVPMLTAVIAVVVFAGARRVFARRAPPVRTSWTWTRSLDQPGVALALVIAVAIGARIVMMLGSQGILWGDSDVFLSTSDDIRAGHYLDHDPFRTLLYPYFLSAFLVFGTQHPMDQVIVGAQHVLGVISAAAFFLLGRRAFGTRIALPGALLFAVHSAQLFYESSILSEAFFICLLSLSLLVIDEFVASPTIVRACATSIACLALTYTRPLAQWFVVIPVVLLFVITPRKLDALRCAAVVIGIYLVSLMPWAALNQRTFGFYGVATGQGLGLFIRTFEIERYDMPDETAYPEVKEILDYGRATQYSPATYVRDELKRRRHSTAQSDRLMNSASMEAIAQHPFGFAAGTFRQWWRLLGGPLGDEQICTAPDVGAYVCSTRTVGYAREPFLNRPRSAHEPVRRWVVRYFKHFAMPMHVVSALAVLGAVAAVAEFNVTGILIAVTAAYYTFLPAAAQSPQDRYRLPVDGLLLMLAVFGAYALIGEVTCRRARAAIRRSPG